MSIKEEIEVGDRIVIVDASDEHSVDVLEFFLDILESCESEIEDLMDRCKIPQEVELNFKPGDTTLDGIYHVLKKEVSEHLVSIDIFTKHLQGIQNDDDRLDLMRNLLETFLHELIHHKYASEQKTDKTAKSLVKKILDKS